MCVTLLLISAVYMCYVLYNITTLTPTVQNIHITQNYSIIIARIYIKLRNWSGRSLRGDWEGNWRSRPSSTHRHDTTLFLYILWNRPLYPNTLKIFGGVLEEDRLWGRHRFAPTSRFVVNYILGCGGVKCQRRRLCILYYKLYIFYYYSYGFFIEYNLLHRISHRVTIK